MRDNVSSLKLVERVTGIGPARPAWKAGILPLNYTRIYRLELNYNTTYRDFCQHQNKLYFLS